MALRDLSQLTAAEFEQAVGTEFSVRYPGQLGTALSVRLVEVLRLREAQGKRGAFVLRFVGPSSPVLDQVIHRLAHPTIGEIEVFLGPVLSLGPEVTYEVVFG